MSFAPNSTYFDIGDGSNLGYFIEKETGNLFEFSENPDLVMFPLAHGGRNTDYPHMVWVTTPVEGIDCGYRQAKVLNTVIHIVTDERADGSAVVERWEIKKLTKYEKTT